MPEATADNYGLSDVPALASASAPALDYKPRDPRSYHPGIGLIGCGGISAQHLSAYKHAGYRVVAVCSRTESRARTQQQQFYPDARVYMDYRKLLRRDDVEVVDITTHPAERVPIIEDALRARKHVLSQKPFVLDLDIGEGLADLAERQGVKLAVNQNGRWAPHFGYIYQAIKSGLLGTLTSVNFSVHWNHNWIIGTPFENVHDLVLYDFAIHWFDLTLHFLGDRVARKVSASAVRGAGQHARPPMLAGALIEFDDALASLAFNANVGFGQEDRTYIAGTNGTITSVGPSLSEQNVTLYTSAGYVRPDLEGTWFREGFHGAMGELLCAVEENRAPANDARGNLRSLAATFAAVASAREGTPKVPGAVRRLPDSLVP